jgi:hypothetical protein
VAPPLPFPPLKFQHKKTYFRDKIQGRNLSESWWEHICSYNAVGAHKLSFFVRLRTLVAAAFFAYFLELWHEIKSGGKKTPRGMLF